MDGEPVGGPDMTKSRRAAVAAIGVLAVAAPAAAAPPWSGQYDDLPQGSYQRSCRDISAFGGRLYARCQAPNGALYDTEIAIRACPSGRIANQNGRLVCEGGGGGGGGWSGGGGYGGSPGLIVYADPDYKGYRLEFSDSAPTLYGSGLDDMITSVRVMRGTWQLCSGPDYNGQCWTVDADTPNLKTIGANDKVSSIRRLPRR